jgi:hypothetical protein
MSLILALSASVASAAVSITPTVSRDSVVMGNSFTLSFNVFNLAMGGDPNPAITFSVASLPAGWTASVTSPSSPYSLAYYGYVMVYVSVTASTTLHAGDSCTVTLNADVPEQGIYTGSSKVKALKANQTITFGALANKVYTEPAFALTGTASSGLKVTYASSDTNVAKISDSTVTIRSVGTTNITASQAGNTDYNAAPNVVQPFTVTKAAQTITFGALTDKTKADPPFALTATASSGLKVTYTSSNTSVATVADSTVTILTAGTTTIRASQIGNTNFDSATSVPQLLTVTGAPQTITFAALATETYLDAPFALTATASSGLKVTYASSDTSVAKISDSTVTIRGAGSAVVTASQAGNADWSAASNVQQTLTVSKASQAITFGALSAKTYTDPAFALSATASSSLAVSYASSNTGVATVSGSTITITGVGTTTITASQSGDNNYFAATSVPQALTVSKASQTITFGTPPNVEYGSNYVLTATSSSGLGISYVSSATAVATVTDSVLTPRGLGTTTITAKQDGNANYLAATDVQQPLTVVKGHQTITFAALPAKSVVDVPFALAATASSGLKVAYSSSNPPVAAVTDSTLTIGIVGSSVITASQDGSSLFYAAASVTQTQVVTKANQTINFTPIPAKSFGDAAFELVPPASSGLPVTLVSSDTNVASISGSWVTPKAVGSTIITASQAGDSRYNAAPDSSRLLTVNKRTQTITFGALSDRMVDNAPFRLMGSASSGLAVSYSSSNTAVATVSNDTVTLTGDGNTTITASQAGNSSYLAATSVTQSLHVGKYPQAITFDSLPIKWRNDPPFTVSATASSGLPVSFTSTAPSVASVSGNTVTLLSSGIVQIRASQAGNTRYDSAVSVLRTLNVAADTQLITFDAIPAKVFDSPSFSLSASASSGLTVSFASSDTNVAKVSGITVTITGAGSTTITASQAGNYLYAPARNQNRTLTVAKANQTISFGALAAKTLDSLPFTISATASSNLAVSFSSSNPAVATVSGTTVTLVGAGTTTITALQGGNANYFPAANVTQTLTVGKGNQVITFAALSAKAMGDQPFALAATASSGLPVSYVSSNTAVATIAGSTLTIKSAGTTIITASQEGNTSYNAAVSVPQTLTVNKGNQTIAFGPLVSKTTRDQPFALMASATSGLDVVYASSDGAVVTVSGTLATVRGAGTATITASQSGNADWNAAGSVAQPLTVRKSQTISFGTLPAKMSTDAAFSISATASSALNVRFTSSDTGVATVSGVWVTIVGAGTTTITAHQDGNSEWAPAPDVKQTLNIGGTSSRTAQTITFSTLASKVVGDSSFVLKAAASSGLRVSYASSDTTVAKIADSIVTIVGPGTTTITASQGGDATWFAAGEVQQVLTVSLPSKLSQTITFAALAAKAAGDSSFALTATASSGLHVSYTSSDTTVAKIADTIVTVVGAGTTTITASQAGNAVYLAAAPVAQILTVTTASQTISFTALPSGIFGHPTFRLSATASSGLPVSYTSSNTEVATVNGSVVTMVGPGTTIISASQAGNGSFTKAADVPQTLTVIKAPMPQCAP